MNEKILSHVIAEFMPQMIRGVQLEFFARHPVTQPQFFMLLAILSYGECKMSVLASNMKISMPTATGVINRLVRSGLVERIAKANDRRQVLVRMTKKGEKLIDAFKAVMRARWVKVLKGISPEDQTIFYGIIMKLQTHLDLAA